MSEEGKGRGKRKGEGERGRGKGDSKQLRKVVVSLCIGGIDSKVGIL